MLGLDAILVVGAVILAVGTLCVVLPIAVAVYQRFGGTRLVTGPENQVRTMLAKFYAGKRCVLCGASFDSIKSWGHCNALMEPGKQTMEWIEIASERLPDVLQSHRPVCWNCHIAETFRRQHGDLVIDRPGPAGRAAHEKTLRPPGTGAPESGGPLPPVDDVSSSPVRVPLREPAVRECHP